MAEINEAYRILSDPGRRAVYDRSLTTATGPSGTGANTRGGAAADADGDEGDDDEFGHHERRRSKPGRVLAPDGPARFPWKPMLVVAIVGSALVLVSAAFTDPPSEGVPDGIIRKGSCVAIEPNGDAREIACTGDDDIVVAVLIPTDAKCPVGMRPHRDRLGLGIACIEP